MNISDLYNLKAKYETFREDVSRAIGSLNVAIDNLLLPSNNIFKAYQKDDIGIDNNSITNSRDNLIKKRDEMNNIVLPEITKKISEIKGSIEAAERAEAERKRAEEEERNRAAQQNNASAPAPQNTTPQTQSTPASTPTSTPSRAGMPSNVPERYRG